MDEVSTNEVEQQEQEQEVRTFTQEEVDEIVSKRIARERKNLPSAEELNEYREWKKSQTPKADDTPTQSDLDSALAEMEMTRRENYLLKQGIDPEDVDYYVYKISKSMDGETDFEDAAKEFLKTHKSRTRSAVTIDTGARLNSGNVKKSLNEQMNDIIRNSKSN